MNKRIYQKPKSRALGTIVAAEGSCISQGQGVLTSSFCTTGDVAGGCSVGGVAQTSPQPVCNSGSGAGVCFANGQSAYG